MKVIIAGGRDFNNYAELCKRMDKILSAQRDVIIISGTANGADKLGEKYAADRGYKVIKCPADWMANGKKAGYIRNEHMAKIADAAVCFWDGKSKGTMHMINIAKRYQLKLRVINYV